MTPPILLICGGGGGQYIPDRPMRGKPTNPSGEIFGGHIMLGVVAHGTAGDNVIRKISAAVVYSVNSTKYKKAVSTWLRHVTWRLPTIGTVRSRYRIELRIRQAPSMPAPSGRLFVIFEDRVSCRQSGRKSTGVFRARSLSGLARAAAAFCVIAPEGIARNNLLLTAITQAKPRRSRSLTSGAPKNNKFPETLTNTINDIVRVALFWRGFCSRQGWVRIVFSHAISSFNSVMRGLRGVRSALQSPLFYHNRVYGQLGQGPRIGS
jgi:hypothetical protein